MRRIMLFSGFFIAIMIFGILNTVFAHCDTLQGPVIKDAKTALETKDVAPVLKWVSKEQEGKIKAAFDNALKERDKDREKADMVFFELLVRIHREGEGASFTGIKPAGTIPEQAVVAADEAIETGSIDSFIEEISGSIAQQIRQRFSRAIETKKHMNESVESGREYVAAYVEFVHYVEGIHKSVAEAAILHHETKSTAEEHHRR
ncbi:MAG: DUF6448 family protein [Spirochaetota bacterium]